MRSVIFDRTLGDAVNSLNNIRHAMGLEKMTPEQAYLAAKAIVLDLYTKLDGETINTAGAIKEEEADHEN
jgi:hypothetical protein